MVRTLDADVVMFNHDLSPAQGRNLEKICECRVITRTDLILDIFAQRARGYEGKLQVELAQLQHIVSRLVGGWTHLERQKGGIGLRGPGETQLETDRRLINNRIKAIKKRLKKVETQRGQNRKARQRAEIPTIALVGYTNAGKSTLFNAMTHSEVYAADQLFATLDPTLRKITLPEKCDVILADTVGFIRDLPHDLVAAFQATLEETCQADLLLHIVDANNPNYQATIDNVNEVLDVIGAKDVPQLLVFNKVDLLADGEPRIDFGQDAHARAVWVSALKHQGIDLLKTAMLSVLENDIEQYTVRLDPAEAGLRAKVYKYGDVKEEVIMDDGCCRLIFCMPSRLYHQIFK